VVVSNTLWDEPPVAGVEEHPILLRERLQRVARSVYPIMGVVYDGVLAGWSAIRLGFQKNRVRQPGDQACARELW
jgi:hypothetical protein